MKFVHQIDPSKFLVFPLCDCPKNYMQSTVRQEYFEMIWFSYKNNDTAADENPAAEQFVCLIPPFRSVMISTEDKKGHLIAFKRDYLEEDDKEYAMDIFNLFNRQGQFSMLSIDPETAHRFTHLHALITEEYQNPYGTYLVLKSLLKVFLLNLVRLNQHAFLNQDINQKRVYEFIMLMDRYYHKERKASFYAEKIGISEKRLNQILKEKMNKTLTQLLHIRLIVEAKRKLISSERTIKEIAYELNFEDRAYFSRFFKKQTGLTAEQFRLSTTDTATDLNKD